MSASKASKTKAVDATKDAAKVTKKDFELLAPSAFFVNGPVPTVVERKIVKAGKAAKTLKVLNVEMVNVHGDRKILTVWGPLADQVYKILR